jgi:hypothetical protein
MKVGIWRAHPHYVGRDRGIGTRTRILRHNINERVTSEVQGISPSQRSGTLSIERAIAMVWQKAGGGGK